MPVLGIVLSRIQIYVEEILDGLEEPNRDREGAFYFENANYPKGLWINLSLVIAV